MDNPPMFDVSKIEIWKVMMSWHLKVISWKAYHTITKKSYLSNSKHLEANAQALEALRKSLSKEYLNMVSHFNSAFAVWNILTSSELQTPNIVEKEFSGEESGQQYYML